MNEDLIQQFPKPDPMPSFKNVGNELSTAPFSFVGGSELPQNPNIPEGSGLPPPNMYMGHIGHNVNFDKSRLGLGATGVSVDTPQGRINKIAGVDVGYEHPSGFYARINKPIGGMNPRFDIGYRKTFADGGVVKMADGGLFDKGGTVTIEGVNYEPDATYTDPMGTTVPSQDEMRLALSKQNMSPMPYSEPYRDPVTGAILKNGLEALPPGFNAPQSGGMTPIDYDNLPKEPKTPTFGDYVSGVVEPATTIGTGAGAFMAGLPISFGKGLMGGDFNQSMEDIINNYTYIPRSEKGLENLELIGKGLEAAKLPALMPELHSLEPVISLATKRGLQLGAKGIKEGVKATKELPVGMSIKDVSPSVTLEPYSPKDQFGFYSKLEKETKNLQRKQGNGQAFMNDLQRLGVKPHELEATGMAEFLKNNKNLTKEDIIGFAERNRPVMNETVLSKTSNYPYKTSDAWNDAISQAERRRDFDEAERLTHAWEEFEGLGGDKTPKHEHHYRTEGGENYREILVQAPNKYTLHGTKAYDDISKQMYGKDWLGLTSEERKNVADTANPQQFTNGHYQEHPNTMINMRLDDRIDVDGKKGTLLDELQSDWHQKGKEEGYASDNPFLKMPQMSADEMLLKHGDQMNPEQKRYLENFIKNWERVENNNQSDEIKQKRLDERTEDFQRWVEKQKIANAIPDAPYKKNWYELGLKKAIQHAVERGDDRLYLSTGKTLADRYDLSKQISNIKYKPLNESLYKNVIDEPYYQVSAKGKNNEEVFQKQLAQSELSDYVGKELAKKIIDGEGETDNLGNKTFMGLDLQVGGEGMRKYYDEIYPSYLKKFAKQYGGHVGETFIDTGREWPFPIEIAHDGQNFWLKGMSPLSDTTEKIRLTNNVKSYEEANKLREGFYNGNNQKVYYYEPSPEAKKKIMGGLPYKDGGVVKMAGGGSIIKKVAQNAIKTASQGKVGQLASKDLLTLQDFHTSLGDELRARAKETADKIAQANFKYNVGDRVFTDWTAKNNYPPYEIVGKRILGGKFGQILRDPNTGKSLRDENGVPLREEEHLGYVVKHNFTPKGETEPVSHEMHIPESSLSGLVEPEEPYKRGGIVKMDDGGSIESDPSLPLRAHLRNFQTPDLLNIQDYGVSAQDNGDAFTLGRQIVNKNAEEENPNLRYRASQDYAQYSTPVHQGMLNARVMKDPEQPSVQAMLQYMQQMGGGTAGVGLMGNRTSEGDKLRALQMMYNKRLSDTSDISGAMVYPFGQQPQFNVQYRKRFADGGIVDTLGNFAGYDSTPPETQQTPKPTTDAFQEALKFTLAHEGGFNAQKHDKPTNYGITQDVYSKYIGKPASIDDLKNMPVEHAHEIYRTQYWNPIQKYNLDVKPAVVAFDTAVNQGPTFANNMLKQTQGDIEAMMQARQNRYADVIKKNPKKAKFKAGWDNRMADLKNYAMEDLYAKGGKVSLDEMKLALTRKR